MRIVFSLLAALFVAALVVTTAVQPAQAQDLPATFKQIDKSRKGVFGLNMLQGTRSKIGVLNGMPSGKLLFQAAYRNEVGQALAEKHDFYVANLYTTNYYELMGEYVFGDKNSSHELDHAGLVAVGPATLAKASSMVRHWVLEKHYAHQFPSSTLARSFQIRGISGSEFELEYASYFFNYYLSVLENDMQFLAVSLLAKGSPIAESSSLDKARTWSASLYDAAKDTYGEKDARTRRLYQLRNAIHNQLSKTVIGQLNQFLKDYPAYNRSGNGQIPAIRDILVSYYAVSAKKVAEAAKRVGANDIVSMAESLPKSGPSSAQLLQLSNMVANLRTDLTSRKFVWEKKSEVLLVLSQASQYLNKELGELSRLDSKDAIKAVVNLIYIEGFLIRDNWQYFVSEIDSASNVASAASQLPDIIGIAGDTLIGAFAPSLDQWITIEPKMNYFMDNTIKSSALNTASLLGAKAQR
jgi:hypothetical protein